MMPQSTKMREKMFEITLERVIEEFEEMTRNAGEIQMETLRKILEQNGNAEYLQSLGLDRRTDPLSFKAHVPVVSHQDLEHYIQRIADEDSSPILTGKPITAISLSSGTTQGKPKYVPFNDELVESSIQIFRTSFAFRNREFPISCGKALQFVYSSKQFKTKGGLNAGTATTNLFRSVVFKSMMKEIQSQSCSPDEVILGSDFDQSLYCHLLCGLLFRDEIKLVFSSFSYSIVHAFQTFEHVWEELCGDIRTGILSSRITALSTRAAVSKLLKPDPQLADLIHGKCSGLKNWHWLIPTLFPNAKYVYGIMTGAMEPYLPKLRHYAGDLPLVCGDYGSSEGWIGVNANPNIPPEQATFAVVPNLGYFEFIPLCDGNEVASPDPVGLTEVKIGEEYEILLTNFAGLYRYRLGDVVKVVGFHNQTPELRFICRRNVLLTINIDKNTERDLQMSVESAAKLLAEENLDVVDFTSYVDFSTDPGHYVIFWEVSGDASEGVLNECCNVLDRSFLDTGYMTSRKINSIGALELRVLWRGTFRHILNHYLGLGAAVSQFKTPRCIGSMNIAVLQILSKNVVKSYFSTAY